jgi:hypothetical protein
MDEFRGSRQVLRILMTVMQFDLMMLSGRRGHDLTWKEEISFAMYVIAQASPVVQNLCYLVTEKIICLNLTAFL